MYKQDLARKPSTGGQAKDESEKKDFEIHWDGVCSGINGAVHHLENIVTSTLTCCFFFGKEVMRYDGDIGGVWIGTCIRFVYTSQHY